MPMILVSGRLLEFQDKITYSQDKITYLSLIYGFIEYLRVWKKRTKGEGKSIYIFNMYIDTYQSIYILIQKEIRSIWRGQDILAEMPFQLRNMSIPKVAQLGPESCMTPFIPAGMLLCLDPQLLLKTNVCYKKWFCIWGYLSTWILGNRYFFKMSLSPIF